MSTESAPRKRAPRKGASTSKTPRAKKTIKNADSKPAASETASKASSSESTSPNANGVPAWAGKASAVAGQAGEVLGHAVGTVQIEARRVAIDGGKLLHKASAEACELSREAMKQAKTHPWATSGLLVGAGAVIGAAVAGYNRIRGKR